MANKDGFPPDDRFPVFLSEQAEETGQPDIGKALNRAAVSSRILKTSIWAVAATAIGIAILSVGDPVALVANVTATWVDKPALQPDADSSTPAIQSIASTQDSPATTMDTPTRDEIAAAVEPADQSQAEIGQPLTEALFKQFQAWADEKDTQAKVEPVRPLQDAQAQAVQDAPAQVRPVKKHRRVRSVQNARAEIRHQRNPRAKVREEQNAREQAPPVPDPRAQEQPAQNSLFPWLPQSFGLRN
ncbi:hypothetical protein IVB30_18060 [Bradyrhizobium sp. 200]|uniref:hypothetical protein n=1 Tax=Bradyrhizobium sp. 200 TaxID=2782665 RepID=UPI001FFEA315|nr:hypothetical protein [Bradyrhizobium sp. 200]UPJ53052.1 hypothetical protein IVB30_18060 [Bradyrhizobium sp. 200]